MNTRDRATAIAAAGIAVAEAQALRDSLTPEEAARRAYTPTGPSIAELTERIRASRTAPPLPAHSGDNAPTGRHGGETGRGATNKSA